METQIATEFGIDLYEVIDWPYHRKMVYMHHLKALDHQKRRQMDSPDGEAPDPGDMDIPQPPNAGGSVPSPSDLKGNMPSPDQPSVGGSSKANFSGRKDVHPKLRRYSHLVNVQNPGEGISQERKAEIMDKPEMTYDGPRPEDDPNEGFFFGEPGDGPIWQASEKGDDE